VIPPAHTIDSAQAAVRPLSGLTPSQRAVSHGSVPGTLDVLATDGLRVLGTLGFFVPAAVLVALVVGAVVRDRRLSAREEADEADEAGLQREALGEYEGLPDVGSRSTPPRAD
jgi:hypothetical protein